MNSLNIKIKIEATPEWEKPCWVVALGKPLKISDTRVKSEAEKNGWDGHSFGATIQTVFATAWALSGNKPDLSLTPKAKGMTAKAFAASSLVKGVKRGSVFTMAHVMPVIDGVVSNFNGHGEEKVVVVMSF